MFTVLVKQTTTATPPSPGFNVSTIASGILPEPVSAKFKVRAGFGNDLVSTISSGILPEPVNAKFKVRAGFGDLGVSKLEVSQIFMSKLVLPPGGNSGWHQHSGPSWIVISSGNITYYDESCKPHVYQAPSAFFEDGTKTHTIANEGSEPAVYYSTLMLPEGGERRIDVDPSPCPS